MTTIDATNCTTAGLEDIIGEDAESRRRKRKKVTECRVRLLKCGPWVRRDVDDLLRFWQKVHGVPIGRAIDAMVDYIKQRDDFRIKILPWKTNSKKPLKGVDR
jgi:hypothetical protein